MMSLLRLLIAIPFVIAAYIFAFLVVAVVFIAIAAVVSAPFILIIGLVLWIFF